jgi:hypothetical protein
MKLREAKEGRKLVELSLIGREYPVSGKVIKLDVLHQSADIERFGAVTRFRFSDVQKIAIPKYNKKSLRIMTKYEEDMFIKCVEVAIDRVIELYKEHYGIPDKNITVDCPMCEQPTNSYFCAWKMGNDVHFHCPHCNFGFIQ